MSYVADRDAAVTLEPGMRFNPRTDDVSSGPNPDSQSTGETTPPEHRGRCKRLDETAGRGKARRGRRQGPIHRFNELRSCSNRLADDWQCNPAIEQALQLQERQQAEPNPDDGQ